MEFKALCADVQIESSMSWTYSKLQELAKQLIFFPPHIGLGSGCCWLPPYSWLYLGGSSGSSPYVIDLSKGWVTLPPANHGLAASPIPGSVGSNKLESLVLPPFSVGVWFYTWPHSNRLWPFSQPSFVISSEIGGPALVLGSALGLALIDWLLALVQT